jgi:cytoskeletal protein CcmA (bactofilin family)
MMFKGSGPQGDLNGFLDGGSHMTGELHFEDTFRIDGRFTGTIVSDGDLIVGERGEVEGEIKVSRVHVSGTVRGVLRALERLGITATGRVLADVHTPSLTIEDGAHFEGRCSMERQGAPGEAGEARDKDAQRENVARMPIANRVKQQK